MRALNEYQEFVDLLEASRIACTLALTGSTARGELRKNSGNYDYASDTDILCIIAPDDIAAALSCKEKCSDSTPLILMSSDALKMPSNAVLSIAFDSLLSNGLDLTKPVFSQASMESFLSYQLQPLAYYTAQLHDAQPQAKRRLYSKIAITCLKLLYLMNHPDRRKFIYEYELRSHPFMSIDGVLLHSLLDRELPDAPLKRVAESLETQIRQCPPIAEAAEFLTSTKLYWAGNGNDSEKIVESVFVENNKLKRSDALFIRAV